MPEEKKRKVMNIAGTFEVDFCHLKQRRKSACAVVELYELIKVFFPGNEEEKFSGVSEVLQNGSLSKGILYFSFPKKIKERYGLERSYQVKLQMGYPTRFYTNDLRAHLDNNCEIITKGLSENEIYHIYDFFRKMSRHHRCLGIRELNLTKWRGTFGVNILFASGAKIKASSLPSLEAVLKVIKNFQK